MQRVRIWAEYNVIDPELLKEFARQQSLKCWGEEFDPPDAASALLEAVVVSNDNPDNAYLGIERTDSGYCGWEEA